MLSLLISPTQWAQADQWCNYTLPTIFIIGGIILIFGGLIPILYKRNKFTWSLFGSISFVLLCVGIYSYQKTTKMKEYFAENRYVSPQTRSYSAELFYEKPYDPFLINQYRYTVDTDFPSHLKSIYKKVKVKQEVEFLGRNDFYVFVRFKNQVLKFEKEDCRLISGDKAYFSGYLFEMRNSDFKKIGFLVLPNKMRDKILVPKVLWNKKVSDNYTKNYDHPGLVGNWITDSVK